MLILVPTGQSQEHGVVYLGTSGPGKGKHIVFLSGDEEYRSEEGLPQLARILAFRHGFKCTVLFPLGKNGEINPEATDFEPGIEALDSADLCVMQLRFREWPDAQMKHFVDYYLSGKPFIALRTSTHAFNYSVDSASPYRKYSWAGKEWPGGFGKQVLGETWVSHWGIHGGQGTRSIVEPPNETHRILKGVGQVFGTTDVYEAAPPPDSTILLRGQVVAGMTSDAPGAQGQKRTALGRNQDINDPMMPIVWLRNYRNEAGKTNRILTSTIGAATDLLDENLRRLIVNGAYWATGIEKRIPDKANVDFVGAYRPSDFGFGRFKRGVKPSDLMWPTSDH
ncbi:MAG: hypothetical protein IT203_11425 [Fimbriimonadaceae bacterium]|nr:hypothetical protein [Fimbriimonadaceae bacterium]